MPVRDAAFCSSRSHRSFHTVLLAGVSTLTLLVGGGGAEAGALSQALSSATASSATGAATAANQASSAAAQAVAQQAQRSMAQAAGALTKALAAQAAARAAAPSSSFNGLGAGALNPVANPNSTSDGLTTWSGANLPTESDANGQYNVTIHQTAAQATLSWDSFNVGTKTTLTFDQQGNSGWIALNRVVGAAVAPSQILGSIKADGSVYVINQNGIIFGAGSQVNVHTLIASAAGITDAQFLSNGIYSTQSGSTYQPSFTNAGGAVTVQAGAEITTAPPASVTDGGGFVLLMGTQVENAGSISTPMGQTMLAAGDNFLIRPGYGTTTNATSTTRGNEIAVQLNTPGSSTTGGSGLVGNSGVIEADTGDITLAGETVVQGGVLLSSTSVDVRGTIHLLSSASDPFGSVTLAADSLTLIAPELSSTATALDSQRAALIADSATQNGARSQLNLGQFDDLSLQSDREDLSRIEIVTGGTVEFQGNSLTMANGGQVSVSAVRRVQVDAGATIDVSGSYGVLLPMSANDIAVNIQGNELRDDPINRDSGTLFNDTVYVDARQLVLVPAGTGGYATDRYYTAGGLLEVSGYLSNTGHTIGEWTAIGGTITLATGAAGAVVAQAGSLFNISGGSLQYQGGYVKQSYLLGTDGNIYNVNSAPADMTYVGPYYGIVIDHAHWGLTETYSNGLLAPAQLYEPGYTVGRDAGSLILSTPTSVFEGDILAGVIDGARQSGVRPSGVTDSYEYTQTTVPLAGTLALGLYNASGLFGVYDTSVQFAADPAPLAGSLSATTPIPADRTNTAWFDTDLLNAAGLGGLSVATGGSIQVGAPLVLGDGGRISFVAPSTDIAAGVIVHGGAVSITNILSINGGASVSVLTQGGTANIAVDAAGVIDTSGVWTNALLDPADVTDLAFVNGGSVSIDSTQGVTLSAGSLIDASSGGALLSTGKTRGGTGGAITLTADDPYGAATPATAAFILDGTLRSIGVIAGGALSLSASSIVIGDTVASTTPGQIVLPTAFFSQGFSSYDLTGYSSLSVAPGANLTVTEPVYQVTPASVAVPTGSDPAAALAAWTPPLYLANPVTATLTQRAGASLTLDSGIGLSSLRASGGSIDIGAGSRVAVDPGQSIALASAGQITVDGTLQAPGGTIDILNVRPIGGTSSNIDPGGLSVWIGGDATLDVAAQAVTALDHDGRPYGLVPDGGSIVLGSLDNGLNGSTQLVNSTDAFIVIRPGAVLDASGASADIDVATGTGFAPMLVASNGGSIALSSVSGIYNDGTLLAKAGGAGAAGGTLSVTLEEASYPGYQYTGLPPARLFVPRVLTIGQAAQSSSLPASLQAGLADPSLAIGQAYVSADQIEAGGFANVSLLSGDVFSFAGTVTLQAGQSIKLYNGIYSDTTPGAQVTLTAPYVLLSGHTSVLPNASDPTGLGGYPWGGVPGGALAAAAAATLTVDADQIDIANTVEIGDNQLTVSRDTSTQNWTNTYYTYAGFNTVALNSSGDISFLASSGANGQNPELLAGGSVTLTAALIYPQTNAIATVAAGINNSNPAGGVLTINGVAGADPALPLSVFGTLLLAGTTVNQGGIVVAPEGEIVLGSNGSLPNGTSHSSVVTLAVNLLPGSITSVSMAGETIPYGGTSDGVTYSYNGAPVSFTASSVNAYGPTNGIDLVGNSFTVAAGATLDLSGGGTLAGAGFISGRGGSVDILKTPLASDGPGYGYSSAGNKVYAIVPSYTAGYAPLTAENGAGDPLVGQQVTIPAGVPGLPAGTYTLLPSNYALLPGAFRVEIGGANTTLTGAVPVGDGTFMASGYLGIANTGIRNALPQEFLLTSATAVATHAQYDQQSYAQFAVAQAATLQQPNPVLPADAKVLQLNFGSATGSALTIDGTVLFDPASGGQGGIVVIRSNNSIEITPSASPTPGFTGVTLDADALDALNATSLQIGGYASVSGYNVRFDGGQSIVVRDGAVLSAPQIFLIGGTSNVTVEPGAEITTLDRGAPSFDSTDGYVYSATGVAVLAISNGYLNFSPPGTLSYATPGSIAVGTCLQASCGGAASLLTDGTIAFSTTSGVTVDPSTRLGAAYLSLVAGTINVGDIATAQAGGAVVPAGITLTEAFLSTLLQGDAALGVPALQSLTLGASQSINFFGSIDLSTIDPATGQSSLQQLVLETPAIYGYGTAGDVATLTTGTLVWNGLSTPIVNPLSGAVIGTASAPPPGAITNGPGSGSGTLDIVASNIVFGYPNNQTPNDQVTLDLVLLGFSNVNMTATTEISANNKSALSVYASQTTYGQPGAGGKLTLATPLLTTAPGAVFGVTAGGALAIVAPAGAAPAQTASVTALGGEIDLTAASVTIDTAVALPSGKFTVNATGDIQLGAGADIDLSGRAVAMFDQTEYSWGGDVTLASLNGSVSQAAGSTIAVAAVDNNAGSLTVTADGVGAGQVALNGTLLGASILTPGASGDYSGGAITVDAQTLASGIAAGLSSDFAALNNALNAGGFFGSRSFDLKQGDLVIGNELRAHTVSVSVDNGSIDVTGTIDASGATPGSISLAAANNLTLESGAVLDAHGAVLQVDSYGQPIDAENRATVALTATQGMLTLAPGAAIDVSSLDPAPQGDVELNVARTGETSGNANIAAAGSVTIRGAATIAVNAFWTYVPTDANGTIVQDNGDTNPVAAAGTAAGFVGLNQIDARSRSFMTAADANAGLQANLAGLAAYGAAFHLRPGVEIDSATPNGNLTVSGDLDLSGYRYSDPSGYGLQVNPSVYGSGEPGTLVIRAGGNLNVYGSITDGFAPPVDSAANQNPDDNLWVLQSGTASTANDLVVPVALTLASGTSFANKGTPLNYAIPIGAGTLAPDVIMPTTVTLNSSYTVPAGGLVATGIITLPGGQAFPAGSLIPAGTSLPSGTTLGVGVILPFAVAIRAMTWPAGASLADFLGSVTLTANVMVPEGGVIPQGANLDFVGGAATLETRAAAVNPANGLSEQGQAWFVAPMLPAGDDSWSIRLVSGADLGAADSRQVKTVGALAASGTSGNLTLADGHSSGAASKELYAFLYGGYVYEPYFYLPAFQRYGIPYIFRTVSTVTGVEPSVVRTGMGHLDLIAGGSFNEASLYGVYTAGTQSASVAAADNLPRGTQSDGTVLGATSAAENAVVASQQAYYPTNGGDVFVSAQGNMTGNVVVGQSGTNDSDLVSDWLWRQGGGIAGEQTAWWINFGTYAIPLASNGQALSSTPAPIGFTGIGALGGGNVTIDVGGNAGMLTNTAQGIVAAIGSTGRVLANGQLVETGGGALTIKVGGIINPDAALAGNNLTSHGAPTDDQAGVVTDLRGNIAIAAGAIGEIIPSYGSVDAADPRTANLFTAGTAIEIGGLTTMPGDSTVTITTRGDLVLGGAGDPGRVPVQNLTPFTAGGVAYASGGDSWFTLWTATTAIDLVSAGGNLTPGTLGVTSSMNDPASPGDSRYLFPPTLNAIAADGDIYFGNFMASNGGGAPSITGYPIELAPSPTGQLQLLAAGSIYADGYPIAISGADPNTAIATPLDPAFASVGNSAVVSNLNPNGDGGLFAFGADTPTTALHANDPDPARIYAVSGDIVDLQFGQIYVFPTTSTETPRTWYLAAKPAWILAGRDIVSAGEPPGFSIGASYENSWSGDLLLNDVPSDISVVSAGRDILYSSFDIAGPGLLLVQAGRNVDMANQGTLQSLGPIFDVNAQNRSSGAGISVLAGVGAGGPDYAAFASLYLNPANAGQVAQTYDDQLYAWLQQRFGYAGTEANAYAYFETLNIYQQGVFLRQVYFDELNASGLEFNDPSSPRYKSYVRGKTAIATLFPNVGPNAAANTDTGDITMYSATGYINGNGVPIRSPGANPSEALQFDPGIHTDFGGTIQTLTPGGATIVGVDGNVAPGGGAGLITQGSGDIDLYADDSILLGQSRIMTTFGGDILAWSATGDINAGRGSKTTVVYTPPRRVYDTYGNVTLSPTVPSTGAGIATLNPIPEVPPGNINLVAPEGTVDAGEAGIRVSGNLNIAALYVLNAANIQVQGTTTGVPVTAMPNLGALTAASDTAGAASSAAEQASRNARPGPRQTDLPSIITIEVIGYGGVGAEGPQDGGKEQERRRKKSDQQSLYDLQSRYQVVGLGAVTEDQAKQWADERRAEVGR